MEVCHFDSEKIRHKRILQCHLSRSKACTSNGSFFDIAALTQNAYWVREESYWFLVQDFVPEDLDSIAGFEPPDSPDSSYNNMQLGSEDYAKEPPLVPPNLRLTILNTPSCMDSPMPLLRPQHVVLNHLYVQNSKSGQSVVALGTTQRFRAKYATVVLYKSLQR